MKILTFTFFTLMSFQWLMAEPLTTADRMDLIDRLDTLKDKAQDHAKGRFGDAVTAFNEGMRSNDAATALYLKCVEKVDFTDRDRKAADFREWKKKNKERLGDEGHALALRHQLRWAVLTMKAAGNRAEGAKLAEEALVILEAMYAKPEEIADYIQVLGQPVTQTPFAKAYGISRYTIKDWPMSPVGVNGKRVNVEGPFDVLIFPALREEKDVEGLKEAWKKRIRYEEIAKGFWVEEKGDSKLPGASLARDEFLLERQPELQWQMEVDLFKLGDERAAAVRMMEHLMANISHTKARDWEGQFRALVAPKEKGAAD